jgi:hypothetical protein
MNSERRVLALALVLAACRPDFGLPVSVVTEPRIIAVEANPPEGLPGDAVTLQLTTGGPEGSLTVPAAFGFCTSPRPLVEANVVSSDCLGPSAAVTSIATQVVSASTTLPTNACLQFGPDTPPQKPGEPPFRPRDPDVSGGYYQPVKVLLDDGLEGIALVRIRCNLPGASAERAVEFGQRYTNNQNPVLTGFDVRLEGVVLDPHSVPANSKVTLHAEWAERSAEPYVVHDRSNDALVDHREALRVSWFTTAGVIPVVATGRGEADLATFTETTWDTGAAGSGVLWAVLRDSRGGSSVQSFAFTVR